MGTAGWRTAIAVLSPLGDECAVLPAPVHGCGVCSVAEGSGGTQGTPELKATEEKSDTNIEIITASKAETVGATVCVSQHRGSISFCEKVRATQWEEGSFHPLMAAGLLLEVGVLALITFCAFN